MKGRIKRWKERGKKEEEKRRVKRKKRKEEGMEKV